MVLLDTSIEFYIFRLKRSSLSCEIFDEKRNRIGYIDTPIFKRTIKVLDGDGTSIIALMKKSLYEGTGLSEVHWGNLLDSDERLVGHMKWDSPLLNPRKLNVWLEDTKGERLFDVEVEFPIKKTQLTYTAMVRDSKEKPVAEVDSAKKWVELKASGDFSRNTNAIHVLDKSVNRLFLLPLLLSIPLINQERSPK